MCDLAKRLPGERESAVAAKRQETEAIFEISQDSPADPLAKAPTARGNDLGLPRGVALDRLVADFDLHGLAYYYRIGWQPV